MSDNEVKDKFATDDNGVLPDGRVVLCGANSYEQKFYFNKRFSKLPESIQKELNIICVLFTEEVGGIFYIVFDADGGISLETNADADDIYYDEVSSGLLIGEIRRTRQELMESLSLYYRMLVLGEKPEEILKELGEE
ncbi:MAG: DUF6145 family protein [Lachnospiraceae bacterium]|nr:DUF6145 family protein [Lachnospiraceae bacterium]